MHALKLADAGQLDLLERAVRETARGRAFLDAYARRLRAEDTDRVLNAIARLGDERTSTGQLDVLRRELEMMAASIAQTRREIAAIKPEAAGNNRIVEATEELDFIVRSTERATAEILTAAEGIQSIAGDLRSTGAQISFCDDLETHATNLMVACSFQDLTGQRVTKVVNALRYLEQRVNAMIEIWGINPDEAVKAHAHPRDTRPDAHLLNGPAREGEGVAQADVDRLLNDASAAAPAGATASQDDIDQLFK
jgi:chemotaxis regulatin CheY-phosphate phosphatase CheZ